MGFLRSVYGAGRTSWAATRLATPDISDRVRVLHVDTDAMGTAAGTTLTDLLSYTLPAGTLNANGKGVRVRYTYTFAATATVKTARLHFGATAVVLNPTTASPNDLVLSGHVDIIRTGAATQFLVTGPASVGAVSQAVAKAAPTADLTADVVIKLTGQNGTANLLDIVANLLVVELL
jgi:hypothetical protein